MCLSPHWCSLCKAKEESVNHIFLHCSYSIQLWWKLFQEVKVSWVIPKGCFELLSTNFKALGKGKKIQSFVGLPGIGNFLEYMAGTQQKDF